MRPLGPGWAVELDGLDAPMVFKSGGQAEAAAQRLAERLSDAGERAEVAIHLRDGTVVSRFVSGIKYEPDERLGVQAARRP